MRTAMPITWSTAKKKIAAIATIRNTSPVVTMRLPAAGPGDLGHLGPHFTHEFRRIDRHADAAPLERLAETAAIGCAAAGGGLRSQTAACGMGDLKYRRCYRTDSWGFPRNQPARSTQTNRERMLRQGPSPQATGAAIAVGRPRREAITLTPPHSLSRSPRPRAQPRRAFMVLSWAAMSPLAGQTRKHESTCKHENWTWRRTP